jgi:uncharacterized protein with NAD-binding domain and iron-sulfur cluster
MGAKKIAILGGGVSALTTAFWLTQREGWEQDYEITVYQQGHRLGGKGASGRNREHGDRIEEHGLHIWMGFYENAFWMIRKAYEELARPEGAPLRTWQDAFKQHGHIVLMEDATPTWEPWAVDFPPNTMLPGDPAPPGALDVPGHGVQHPHSPWDAAMLTLDWLIGLTVTEHPLGIDPEYVRKVHGVDKLKLIVAELAESVVGSLLHAFGSALRAAKKAIEAIAAPLAHNETVQHLFDALRISDALKHAIEKLVHAKAPARRLFVLLDLGTTCLRGVIADGLLFPPHDYLALDETDFKAWLKHHGAAELTIESAPVNAVYDLVFARTLGFATGAVLYDLARMCLSYKGSVFWKMQAGMGDTIFTPLYEVLRKRGVRFEFFHRVRELQLSEDKSRIERVVIGQQATVQNGAEYQPLVDVKGLPCWPSEALFDQLVEGEALKASSIDLESFWYDFADCGTKVLKADEDFDAVVLGISIGAFPHIASQLIDASGRFAAMVENVKTCRTQAMQLWFEPTLVELGWGQLDPQAHKVPPVLGTYVKPFDTWADMTHLLPRETWPAGGPKNVAYLCGHLADPAPGQPDTPASERARARDNSIAWLRGEGARHIWPNAMTEHGQDFAWSKLHDPKHAHGIERFEAQYHRANTNPSDRYVHTPPGSTKHRLFADESGFDNLVLAGDWVKTHMNGGCVEAATMAGMQAARALTGFPDIIHGDFERHVEPMFGPRSLARYIERDADMVRRQPFSQNGSTLYAYGLDADERRLGKVVDKCLNFHESPVRYAPLGPFVVLAAANIDHIESRSPAPEDQGWMPERDVAIWVPVVRSRRDANGLWVAEEIVWFLPYIFVDSGLATVTGREVYGFPKQAGAIEMPATVAASATLRSLLKVELPVRPTFDKATKVVTKTLIEVTRASQSPLQEVWRAAGAARTALIGMVSTLVKAAPALQKLIDDLLDGRVELVFLKQFRDAADPRRAAYQAVIEASAVVTKLGGGGLVEGDTFVDVTSFASVPIASELGLGEVADGQALRLTPRFATWVQMDFDVIDGREVYRASPR